MNPKIEEVATKLLAEDRHKLTEVEKRFVRRLAERRIVSANVVREYEEHLTFGQRIADRIAEFGGSWTFIIIFLSSLVAWMAVNTILLRGGFDPYPYILLNLMLSCVAALQAPVIMMSQNRQAMKDRLRAEQDYEVNLKSEFEIMQLHEKVEALQAAYIQELRELERRQTIQLEEILALLEEREEDKTRSSSKIESTSLK